MNYYDEIKNNEILSSEELKDTFDKYYQTNSLELKEKLINANLRLVVKYAVDFYSRYNSGILDVTDYIAEGNYLLLKIINDKKYNFSLGSFSNYLYKCLYGKFIAMFYKNNSAIDVDVRYQEQYNYTYYNIENYYNVVEDKVAKENIESITLISSIKKILNEEEFDLLCDTYGISGRTELKVKDILQKHNTTLSIYRRKLDKIHLKLKNNPDIIDGLKKIAFEREE